ncbi:hypothetical protein NIES21_61230 (plasmid) [Anabaenopsis circularis NIES-21]|uniref:Uncharacterized protein n=1 Tax=Anabaenopsis circularis NIES-21 TaxID=1085406 RepID=A0A1Z4GRX6_9CYAN|nr:hypothetical protein NIES21_61230 [Anabaenopsis circularis NIES-21]
MVAVKMPTAFPQELEEINAVAESKDLVLIYSPKLVKAMKELGVPHPAEAGIFINQLAYWQQSRYGYYTKDGTKWIYNSYEKWTSNQFTSLSPWQLGKMVRCLEELEIIKKTCFASVRRHLVSQPSEWHPHKTSSWITLNVERLVELTGCYPHCFGKSPEPLSDAEIANATTRDCIHNNTKLQTQFSSIYQENSISTQEGETLKKKDEGLKQDLDFDPWNDGQPLDSNHVVLKQETLQENKVSHEDSNSGRGGDDLQNFTNPEKVLNDDMQVEAIGNSDISRDGHYADESTAPGQGFKSPRPKPKSKQEVKEIWEIAPGRPYPVLLNWWADRKYKPQGGKWEADARGNAYAEFYNNRHKTTVVIFPEFLEYMQQVAQNCNQQLANGIKAILPSCFVARPEATDENVQQLMLNIQELVSKGVQVALPTSYPTPSCIQSMSFADAESKVIAPLQSLQALALETKKDEQLMEILKVKQITWKNVPMMRGKIEEWVKNTPGVVMTDDGPVAVDCE